jgi:hypothetical protein
MVDLRSYLRLHRSTAIIAETFNKIIFDLAIGNNSVIEFGVNPTTRGGRGWGLLEKIMMEVSKVTWKFDITS